MPSANQWRVTSSFDVSLDKYSIERPALLLVKIEDACHMSIDLSVGAIVGLSAVMLGYAWKTFAFPLPLAIVFALFVGGLAGFVNGQILQVDGGR